VIGGAVFGGLAHSQAADVNAKFAARSLTPADQSTYDSARGNAMTANVLLGLGGVSLLGSGVLFVIDPGASSGGGDGLSFALSGTFE